MKSQVVFITGGGRGIGRTIATHFAAAGAAVAITGRDPDSLAEAVRETKEAAGRILALPCDVLDLDALSDAVRQTEEKLGPITLLINNAGIGGTEIAPIWELDPNEWWHVMEVNLKGPFLTTRLILPGMVERGYGRIINVSSYQAIEPNRMASAYSTSKAALLRLTDCTAVDLDDTDIAVFAISPGFVMTDMTQNLEAMIRKQNPDFPGFGDSWMFSPEDAARLCLHLASGEADQLSGRMIHVRDDLNAMIVAADTIVAEDRYALRLTVNLDD